MTSRENFKLRAFIRETIRKIGDEYVVYPKRGGKRLGTHSTRAAAKKQLQAIHIQQHNEGVEIKYINPNFEIEWEEANRYPEFKKMGKDNWIKIAKQGKSVLYNSIKDVLGNVDLNFKGLEEPKKERFQAAFKKGVIEMPIAVKFNEKDYDLIAGNTRLSGLINNGINPKIWVVDISNLDEMLNYPNWLRFQAQTPGNFPDGEHRFRLPKKKKLKETAGIMTAAEKAKHEKNMLRLRKILNKQPNSYIPYPDIPNTLQRKLHDKSLPEASYEGNMGFEEMMKFHRIATEKQVELLNKLIDQDKIKEAWKLVQKVVGVKLVGKEFNEQNESNQPTVASLAKQHNRTESTIRIALKRGIEKELTYVNDVLSARQIALDNLYDDPDYYAKISQLNV